MSGGKETQSYAKQTQSFTEKLIAVLVSAL